MEILVITAEYFEQRVGEPPLQDDLERANCLQTGEIGHFSCGWCERHDLPRAMCSCPPAPYKTSACQGAPR